MRCSKCGTNNPSTNNFCAKCGNALAKHCPKCNAENPRILPTIAQHNMRVAGDFGTLPCAGVYADVVKPGAVRRGDPVHCLD
ncbi:MAG: zinc ribbon domain-containing protein [Candidatus Binatus sp.]